MLDNSWIEFHGRQIVLPHYGPSTLLKLKVAKVLVVGAGGLGSPVLLYLTGGGIGELGIVDGDIGEVRNLHRQIIHTRMDVGRNKAESARDACLARNPLIKVLAYPCYLDRSNALRIIETYDFVLDCTDNPKSRYLINSVCCLLSKPWISAAACGYTGQVLCMGNDSNDRGCYSCLLKDPPRGEQRLKGKSDLSGIMSSTAGFVGIYQAHMCLRMIGELWHKNGRSNELTIINTMATPENMIRRFYLSGDKDCNVCQLAANQSEFESILNDIEETKCDSILLANDETDFFFNMIQLDEWNMIDGKKIIIDVRSPEAYETGKLDDSINIPSNKWPSILESSLRVKNHYVDDREDSINLLFVDKNELLARTCLAKIRRSVELNQIDYLLSVVCKQLFPEYGTNGCPVSVYLLIGGLANYGLHYL